MTESRLLLVLGLVLLAFGAGRQGIGAESAPTETPAGVYVGRDGGLSFRVTLRDDGCYRAEWLSEKEEEGFSRGRWTLQRETVELKYYQGGGNSGSPLYEHFVGLKSFRLVPGEHHFMLVPNWNNRRLEQFGATPEIVCYWETSAPAPKLTRVAEIPVMPISDVTESTNSEIPALLKRIEATSEEDVQRDPKGNVVSLALRGQEANDRNFRLVSQISSLHALTIHGAGHQETGRWTKAGISALQRLTNLAELKVLCLSITNGAFQEMCKLKELTSLTLFGADAPAEEYASLTNLQKLAQLSVTWSRNFGDREVGFLTNLPNLRSLRLNSMALSPSLTNALSSMKSLTNIVLPKGFPFKANP